MELLILLRDKNVCAVWFQFVRLDDSENLSRHHKAKAKDIFYVITIII